MFSIIIPYYKKRQYIERCLDAVLSQTFQDFEIILVDDGSQDDIADLVADKYSGKLKLIQQKNQGVSVARNKGIANATRDYIAFLDADDCWCTKYLEYVSHVLKNQENVKIIGSGYSSDLDVLVDKNEDLIYQKIENYFTTSHIRNLIFLTSATVIKKEFFQKNDGFNPKLKRGEDIDVWFRVMITEGNAYQIVNKMIYYSNEDAQQLTKQTTPIEVSIMNCMFDVYKPLFEKHKNKDFEKFINLFTLYQLFKYYDETNWVLAKKTFKNRTKKLTLFSIPYYFPLFISKTKIFKKYALYYFKTLIMLNC